MIQKEEVEEVEEEWKPDNVKWIQVERMWNLIPIKLYSVSMASGRVLAKKFLYKNIKNHLMAYELQTDMPNIVSITTPQISLAPQESKYIKLKFSLPKTACIVSPKIAFVSSEDGVAKEGLQFDVTVVQL